MDTGSDYLRVVRLGIVGTAAWFLGRAACPCTRLVGMGTWQRPLPLRSAGGTPEGAAVAGRTPGAVLFGRVWLPRAASEPVIYNINTVNR